MSSDVTTVFYAGMVYAQHDASVTPHQVYKSVLENQELFNGCFIHWKGEWLRGDLTPVLEVDVPKELLMLILLLS